MDNQNPQNGVQQPTIISQNIHSQADKIKLVKVLASVCALQKQYGKTPNELEALVEGFSRILKHIPMDIIIQAIDKYSLNNNDIPTPSDINKIINPPPQKIDWPLYIELKKRSREGYSYITREEKQFMRNCEDMAILRQTQEMQNYQSAQAQLARPDFLELTHNWD